MYANRVAAARERRGVVLLIVLAMLGLLAAVGISFAVLAKSESTAARNFKRTITKTDSASDAAQLFQLAINQLIYDTDEVTSGIRGHSLLRDMYGSPIRGTGATAKGAEQRPWLDSAGNQYTFPYQGAYNGTGMFLPRNYDGTGSLTNAAGDATFEQNLQIMMLTPPDSWGRYSTNVGGRNYFPLLPYNFTQFDAIGSRPATSFVGVGTGSATSEFPEPERFWDGTSWHWFGADEDYDAADHNNWFLGMERADGTMIVPSFHRPFIVNQLEKAGVFNSGPALTTQVAAENETPTAAALRLNPRRVILRPRQVDYDYNTVMGTGSPALFPTLRDLNGNGIYGDIPDELDVDTDGDGKPDALWMDLGARPFRAADGTLVKPLFAFKVVGMDGKVNINLAGNFAAMPPVASYATPADLAYKAKFLGYPTRPEGHVSWYGASPAEINPKPLFLIDERQLNTYVQMPTGGAIAGNGTATGRVDGNKGFGWPVWVEPVATPGPNDPLFKDPLYLRYLMTGTQPQTLGGTVEPAPVTQGRWNDSNIYTAKITNDRAGVSGQSDNGAAYLGFNSSTPVNGKVNAVASSLGPVSFRGLGYKFDPWSWRAEVRANPNTAAAETEATSRRNKIFPTFVNHVHDSPNALPPPGYTNNPNAYWPPGAGATDPVFGVAPNATINPPNYYFDVFPTGFNLTGTGVAAPNAPNFTSVTPGASWMANPGRLPVNNNAAGAQFAALLTALQTAEGVDAATDFNPYTASTYDTGFSFSQLEKLLRNSDIDSAQFDDRLQRLMTFTLGNEVQQTLVPPYSSNLLQSARERAKRFFTPESWDIINFSNSPQWADDNPPTDALTAATMTAARNPLLRDDENAYVAAPASGARHNGRLPWTLPISGGAFPGPGAGGGAANWYPLGQGPGSTIPATYPNREQFVGRVPREMLEGRRYDLNRALTAYEGDTSTNKAIADAERSAMAQQIYVILYFSAGLNLRPTPANIAEAKEAFAQARTIAQLAVNIVDYIDPDTVMTRMVFHPNLANPGAGANWDALQTFVDGNPAPGSTQTINMGGTGSPINVTVTAEEMTVMGFELPELVISEGVSVTFAGKAGSSLDTKDVTFVFAELFNPWPNETDFDSGLGGTTGLPPQARGTLYDGTKSRFLLGVRQKGNAPAAGGYRGPAFLTTASPTYTDNDYYVGFGPADGDFTQPRNTAPNATRVIRGGQRLLVEPNVYTPGAGAAANDPGPDPTVLVDKSGAPWAPANPTNPADTTQNRFTTHAPPTNQPTESRDLRIVRDSDATNNDVTLSLYRLRNPYAAPNVATNPYIAIDSLDLKYDTMTPANGKGGYRLDWTGNPVAPNARKSYERKQPWQGYKRLWTPYKGLTGVATLYDAGTNRFLEGKFLGFPYLTHDATGGTAGPVDPDLPDDGNQLRNNGFALCTDTVRGHTLFGVPADTAPTNINETRNSVDAAANGSRYVSFPFLNRQLASPLELLSVRMYGSHMWSIASAGGSPADGREWKLRFTDDFEFIPGAVSGSLANYPALPGGENFNRIFRSRETPWYLADRGRHPIDPTATTQYNPDAAVAPATANSLAPFPNLYRFFEFVETHSRVNGAMGSANAYGDGRQSRVPGKINLNLVADEEILKALFDDEAIYPWTADVEVVAQNLKTLYGTYSWLRPVNYPLRFSDPAIDNNPVGVNTIAWNPPTGTAEMLNSTADATQTLVISLGQQIDFGGGATYGYNSNSTLAVNNLSKLSTSDAKVIAHMQYPGIINGYAGFTGAGTFNTSSASATVTQYPGWERDNQVSNDLVREIFFSRSGRDIKMGTGDDKPFRSFASSFLSDTLLRRRNFAALDFPQDGHKASTASAAIAGSNGGAPGEYVTKLGGQVTPRLFDPVPKPFHADPVGGPPTLPLNPNNTRTIARRADVAGQNATPADPTYGQEPKDVDYWMLETRRNSLLAKMANNTTTRSHVFSVWVTIGYFKVQPGTENLKVPLLNEEYGTTEGKVKRSRAFFVVDRSRATRYDASDVAANPSLEGHPLIPHYTIIE